MHVCRGCCSSEGDSLEKAVKLVQAVFLRALTAPALNKWTTVAPCINLVSAMQHFCNVVPEAFRRCFDNGPQANDSESEDEGLAEDKELGVPLEQTKVW